MTLRGKDTPSIAPALVSMLTLAAALTAAKFRMSVPPKKEIYWRVMSNRQK